MSPAAASSRLLAFLAVVFLTGSVVRAADVVRLPPSRPGANASTSPAKVLPVRKFARTEYVNLADVASDLGLQFTWLERRRKVLLSGPGARAEIEADTREIEVNGLRVFLGDAVIDADGRIYVSKIDYERCLTPLLRPGHRIADRPEPKIVVIDPGHGGRDPGNINARLRIDEKTFALDVALRLRKLLEAAGYRVFLTREADTSVDLARRAATANANRADLFVSIHFNALPNDVKTSGMEIYTFAPTRQHATGWWSYMLKNDPHLETEDQPVNRFDHWSVVLAQTIQRRFIVDLKLFDRGKKLAHWGMLRGLTCPGVLVECGFLTSDTEARKIATAEYRQKLADALADGIGDYRATLRGLAPRS